MSASKRKPKYYKPEWSGPIEGYVVNFTLKNEWRVAATLVRNEIVSEAFLVFCSCAEYYPKLEAPQHFMALFKRAWSNRFTDLANADTKLRTHELSITAKRDADGDEMPVLEPMGETENAGVLSILVRQAPAEVAAVLRMFVNTPTEILELALGSWNPHGKRGNQGSARLNKLLGFPHDFDSVGAVYAHFTGETRIASTAA